METGKVYRVNAYAVSRDCSFRGANRRYVELHGHLWVCEGRQPDHDEDDPVIFYNCRSVATGNTLSWTDEEMEEAG